VALKAFNWIQLSRNKPRKMKDICFLLFSQVISVIKRHPSVQKISFVGHSLGGLVARYAIARLYGRDISAELSMGNGHCEKHVSDRKYEGKIAGLEPINFITSATPHLGSRGHKQVILW